MGFWLMRFPKDWLHQAPPTPHPLINRSGLSGHADQVWPRL